MSAFVLHPDALADLTEIWEFIAADNPAAHPATPSFRTEQADAFSFHVCSRKRFGLRREKSLCSFLHLYREILHHHCALNAMKSLLLLSPAHRGNCSAAPQSRVMAAVLRERK
jgi:hypothetical protein